MNQPVSKKKKNLFLIFPHFFENLNYVDSAGALPSLFRVGEEFEVQYSLPATPSQGKYRPIWLLGTRASLQPAELFLQRRLLDSAKHSASVQFEDLMMPGAAK